MQARIRLDRTLLAVEGEHTVHALLELAAPDPPATAERVPLALALVIDRSGSMGGPKLEVARRCADWLVGRLRPTDELALVAYDDEVRVLAPLAPVRAEPLRAAISRIRPGGQTNLSGGWLAGREQLAGAAGGAARTILLLTDGLANCGITDPAALVELARSAYRDRVGTSTVGFGEAFDEELLTALADAGGGKGHYAPTPDAAPAIFADQLDGLTRLVAQNVSVEIRPVPEVDLLAVLNDHPQEPVPGGVRLALGDAYGGERRRVVFTLHLPHLAALSPAKVADVVIRYVSVGDEIAEHTLSLPLAANLVSADEAAAAAPDLEVQEAVLVLKAARARDEAIRLADGGRHDEARSVLGAVAAELRRDGPALGPECAAALAEEAAALDEAIELASAVHYSAASRKQLHYDSNRRRRQAW